MLTWHIEMQYAEASKNEFLADLRAVSDDVRRTYWQEFIRLFVYHRSNTRTDVFMQTLWLIEDSPHADEFLEMLRNMTLEYIELINWMPLSLWVRYAGNNINARALLNYDAKRHNEHLKWQVQRRRNIVAGCLGHLPVDLRSVITGYINDTEDMLLWHDLAEKHAMPATSLDDANLWRMLALTEENSPVLLRLIMLKDIAAVVMGYRYYRGLMAFMLVYGDWVPWYNVHSHMFRGHVKLMILKDVRECSEDTYKLIK